MNRDDFKILDTGVIYFDNGATTYKPNCVVDSIVDYYTKYTANAHRGDYNNSLIVDSKVDETRTKIKDFINASRDDEIIFTSGSTEGINIIVNGYLNNILEKDDEVLITLTEHASNVLPFFRLREEKGICVKYIDLDDNYKVTVDNVLKSITNKTKVISIAGITNVLGDERPIHEIGKICREKGIIFIVDGAQSVPHIKTDVINDNIDFLVFSGHKMLGPTGIGVLYGRYDLLDKVKPINLGGGMNSFFESDFSYELHSLPTRFEAGTPNIAGIIGLSSAVDYISNIGFDKIREHELELKKYFMERSKEVDKLIIYNPSLDTSSIAFNIDGIFSQDTASYLNHYNICVRAGNHCAKLLKEVINVKNTCRITFYLYNTKEEIDKLIDVLKNSKDIYKVIL